MHVCILGVGRVGSAMAIDLARAFKKTLWICRGEKDTEVMLEAGELAIGIPSALGDQVLSTMDLTRFQGNKRVHQNQS